MKRKTAMFEIGANSVCIWYAMVRVIGVNKKTGKVWIKRATDTGMQTRLIDASELRGA